MRILPLGDNNIVTLKLDATACMRIPSKSRAYAVAVREALLVGAARPAVQILSQFVRFYGAVIHSSRTFVKPFAWAMALLAGLSGTFGRLLCSWFHV